MPVKCVILPNLLQCKYMKNVQPRTADGSSIGIGATQCMYNSFNAAPLIHAEFQLWAFPCRTIRPMDYFVSVSTHRSVRPLIVSE